MSDTPQTPSGKKAISEISPSAEAVKKRLGELPKERLERLNEARLDLPTMERIAAYYDNLANVLALELQGHNKKTADGVKGF